jgi:acyl-CoA synthetase (AMP-forming)/AMP-acid ligase II
MIVTEEGKNIYPEDVEAVFEHAPAKELCVFAANYLWPTRTMTGEQLVLVVHPEAAPPIPQETVANLAERNRRLLPYKRVGGYLIWNADFPRTASMKVKRAELAGQIRNAVGREAVVPL